MKVREKPKGSGTWWVFINHHGRRKSKRIGKDENLANDVAKKIEARLTLGEFSLDNSDKPKMPNNVKHPLPVYNNVHGWITSRD